MSVHVENKPWWDYLEEDMQESLKLSLHLSDVSAEWSTRFHDYSFVVFPAAKSYEGFLKKLFLDMGFISEKDYHGKHFRIGKSLNPDLDRKFRDNDWVYPKLVEYCKGKELPEKLWKTWRQARNLLFHWFPDEKNAVDHNEATERLLMIIGAIDEVFKTCALDIKKHGKPNN